VQRRTLKRSSSPSELHVTIKNQLKAKFASFLPPQFRLSNYSVFPADAKPKPPIRIREKPSFEYINASQSTVKIDAKKALVIGESKRSLISDQAMEMQETEPVSNMPFSFVSNRATIGQPLWHPVKSGPKIQSQSPNLMWRRDHLTDSSFKLKNKPQPEPGQNQFILSLHDLQRHR